MDPSWFVEWVQIKLENGDQYRCNVNGWIDHRFVSKSLNVEYVWYLCLKAMSHFLPSWRYFDSGHSTQCHKYWINLLLPQRYEMAGRSELEWKTRRMEKSRYKNGPTLKRKRKAICRKRNCQLHKNRFLHIFYINENIRKRLQDFCPMPNLQGNQDFSPK